MAAAQPSSRHALALPPTLSPDDLDTLSELSTVLAKVRAGIQSSSGLTAPGGGGTGTTPGANNHNNNSSGGGGSGAGGHGGAASAGTGSGGGGGGGNDAGAGNAQQLSFKDVPGATDGIKHKLQHARAQIRALPDMDRSIDDQQREIAELEARIDRQRQLLERLRERGVQFGKENGAGGEDVKMEM